MKKVYHLTIEYDEDTEQVENLLETVDLVDEGEPTGEVEIIEIGGVDISKYFDPSILKLIAECYEIGEA